MKAQLSLPPEINPFDPLLLQKEFRNATPYPFLKIDQFLSDGFAEEVFQSFPTYENSKELGLEFKGVNELKKIQITDAKKFTPPLEKLNRLLASSEFLNIISEITDIPKLKADADLSGGGLHQTASGGHLDVHVDFNYLKEKDLHRRLNILVFFNKNWQPEWGGQFEIWDENIKKCHHSFEPLFNRCVIFQTSEISFHGVTPVQCPKGETRKSFAAYYYTQEAPAHWNGKSHNTIFVARPNEKMKGMIHMPLEKSKAFLVKHFIPKSTLPALSRIKQNFLKK